MKRVVLMVLCLSLSVLAGNGGKTTPLSFGVQHRLDSKILGQKLPVNVFVPESHDLRSEEHVYPVVFIFGSVFFQVTAGVVDHLGRQGQMPRSIVVNLPETYYHAPNVYTNGMWGEQPKQLNFNADPDTYSRFLREELFPFLKKHYRTADYRIAMGASSGSVYLYHGFLNEPDLFQAYIAVASADMMGMGYAEGKTFVDAFEDHLKAQPKRKGFFYATSADDDALPGSMERKNFEAFETRMAPYARDGLFLKTEVFPETSHYGSWLNALHKGLKHLFPTKVWDVDYRDFEKEPGKALANADAYYEKMSKDYGFTILPDANRWNLGSCLRGMGRRLSNQGRMDEAIAVLERWVAYEPTSKAAKDALTKAKAKILEK